MNGQALHQKETMEASAKRVRDEREHREACLLDLCVEDPTARCMAPQHESSLPIDD